MIRKTNLDFDKKRKTSSQPFLEKNVDEKRKAISPLVATILIIVVAVAIIMIVLNWGKAFTQGGLQDATNVTSFTTSDASSFIFRPDIKGQTLTFTYSPPASLKSQTIIVDRFSVLGYEGIIDIDPPVTLREGLTGIQNLDLSSLDIQERTITIVFYTTNNEIITLKNIDLINYVPPEYEYYLYGWGSNYYGKLTFFLNLDVISAGQEHSLGIRNGELYAWGYNQYGQLGDGTTYNELVPTRIGTDSDWTMISASGSHSLGIRNGELYAWGENVYGQLGDGTTDDKLVPTRIGTDSDWTIVSAGYEHSFGLKNS